MNEHDLIFLILLVGTLIVLCILIKNGLDRTPIPALVGFIGLGFLVKLSDTTFGFLSEDAYVVFNFLAKVGVITLLFRIGLESKVSRLMRQLNRAGAIWIGDVFLSGILGFVVSYYLLHLSLIPSLFVGTALTATSVGISAGIWQEAGAIRSETGETLLDVAEMDDISGIGLMAILFAIIPQMKEGVEPSLLPILGKTVVILGMKLLLFGAFCFLFSRYIEERLTHCFRKFEPAPSLMLTVAGIGFIMAALAGLVGFSVAIGAFFAGLVFSRDPESVKIDASFGAVYQLFSPFFFIGIGLSIEPQALTTAFGVGGVLLLAALVGKVAGGGMPALLMVGRMGAILLGFSMIPRAEIAMIIMQRGLELGEWAVPSNVFAGMVIVSAGTCILSPVIVRTLLRRWPQTERVD
ncbi:MAG: cation:proton antiporter [Candidatus Abyssubacteria bacterium]